jgi:hypothetical protein
MKSISVDPTAATSSPQSPSKGSSRPFGQPQPTHHEDSRLLVHKVVTDNKLDSASPGNPWKASRLEDAENAKDSLILDLQSENRKLLEEVGQLRQSRDELQSVLEKYTSFKKTVAYYSSMMKDIISRDKVSEPAKSSKPMPKQRTKSVLNTRGSIYDINNTAAINAFLGIDSNASTSNTKLAISVERINYLKNLISGLHTFSTTYDNEHGNSGNEAVAGISVAGDMMTASITMANTLRTQQQRATPSAVHQAMSRSSSPPNKLLLGQQRPIILDFVHLPHATELQAAKIFSLLLYAEHNLFELTHNSADSIAQLESAYTNNSANNNAINKLNVAVRGDRDVTSDQYVGKRAFLTVLFIVDAYDER